MRKEGNNRNKGKDRIMSKKVYYKLVNANLTSWVAYGILTTKYKVGKWVFAKKRLLDLGYGLTVFKSFKDLQTYYSNRAFTASTDKIYECEIGNIIKKPKERLFITGADSMKDFREKLIHGSRTIWPIGTVMTDSVKLTKEVSGINLINR